MTGKRGKLFKFLKRGAGVVDIKEMTALNTRQYSEWREIWKRLRQSKPSMVALAAVMVIVFVAVFADLIVPYDYLEMDLEHRLEGPSLEHWFGTDIFGRDELSRVMQASKISVSVGFASVGIAMVLGTIIGLTSGYIGGGTDNFIMRIMDVIFSFPPIFLAIVVMAYMGQGLFNVIIIIGLVFTPGLARVVRGSVLIEKEKDYTTAARSIGVSRIKIMFLHIFPNVLAPVIVLSTLMVATAILIEASLSFIGLGTLPPDPTWGNMLAEARTYIRTVPLLCIFPGVAIMITVLGFNLLGDGIRDAMDPRLRT